MSRHRVSTIELLLGLFGTLIGLLFSMGAGIWHLYSQTFDDLTPETQQGSDNE